MDSDANATVSVRPVFGRGQNDCNLL